MNVVIAAVSEDCPAVMALRKEGVLFELFLMEHEYSYSDMFTTLWKRNQGFVSIEHDIVPWPGAIEKLQQCIKPWCSYEYPLAPGTLRPALGCIKVADWTVHHFPNLYKMWENRKWNYLDGSVCPALESVTGRTHIHTPPVAHVKK
jgi:hypothetical protein